VLAPKAPKIAAKTARVLCVGEIGVGVALDADVNSTSTLRTLGSGSPVIGSTGGVGNSHAGRATSKTPVNAMSAASASRTVKGSRSQMKQTNAVSVGIINVITVASEMFSQERES
jgi:hypothetical protein